MKRCPQCEFIYEDEQNLCDMDGQSLVYDQVLSVPQSQSVTGDAVVARLWWRGIATPGFVGLLLAAIICAGYYASLGLFRPVENRIVQMPAQLVDLNSPVRNISTLSYFSYGSASAFELETPESTPGSVTPETESEIESATDKRAHANLAKNEDRLHIARSVPPLPRLRPLPRLPSAKPLDKKPAPDLKKSASGPTPKQSKLGNFLKKTGQVLTKPFKL